MSKQSQVHLVLLFLLTLGFIVRLYKIDSPIADWHSWRQADTAAVTRNFVKYGPTIFYPRFDDLSDTNGKNLPNPTGLRYVEFPIFNIIHYLFYTSFPNMSLETWGRLTSVLSSLVSAIFIFVLTKRHASEAVGLLACAIFLFLPFNIYFSRVVLPDPMMVTFSLAALLLFDLKYVKSAVFIASLALLLKPTAIFFLIPAIWAYKNHLFKPNLYISILTMIAPLFLWRFFISFHPEAIPNSAWLLNGNGIRFKPSFFRWIFGERISGLFMGGWGMWPLLSGVGLINGFFATWLFGTLVYLVIFATGNVQHDYYQIPVIPIISILFAIGLRKLFSQSLVHKLLCVVTVVFLLGFTYYDIKGNYAINHRDIITAGNATSQITPTSTKILAPYNHDSSFLYHTNRPGFPAIYKLPIKDYIDRHDVSYYVSVNYDSDTNAIMSKYITVDKTPQYVIVKLQEPYRL